MSNGASHASLCLLSYNRAQFVQEAIRSARETADYPLEIIVHDDGSDHRTQDILHGMLQAQEFSKLILNPPGQNQGVGESVRAAFAAASGEYLIKADQDLIFRPGWLSRAIDILGQRTAEHGYPVGMVGLFHYHHAPAVSSQMRITQEDGWQTHQDFISSAFVIKRELFYRMDGDTAAFVWPTHSDAFAEDVAFKLQLLVAGYVLALPNDDLVLNRGFGVGPSTVALGTGPGQVAKIHHEPVIFRPPSAPELLPGQDVDPLAGIADPIPLPTIHPDSWAEDFKVGVVITTCMGREQNLAKTLAGLDMQTFPVQHVVIVWDGCPPVMMGAHRYAIRHVEVAKHKPGLEQPRNVGVRNLREVCPDARFVWFIDSDIVMEATALQEFHDAHGEHGGEDAILYGPYEWLPPSIQGEHPEIHNDGRWVMFQTHGREHLHRGLGAVNVALGAFGGNIIYPIAEFERVGGFWNELHHGRCEDGELGVRALSLGCPFAIVAKARGYHQYHNVDMVSALEKNKRDVPMLDARHPFLQTKGLVVTQADGRRFEWICPTCSEQMNVLTSWGHVCSP